MAMLPDFSAATFVSGTVIDNSYFPLLENRILSYKAEETDPETGEVTFERNDLFTTSGTFTVRGVETTVVHDTVYDDEIILEDTLDFYAQDTTGNVWYFGEIVINYEYDDEGAFLGTNIDGAWLADDPGNEPGILMPAEPAFGPAVYEEFAPGVALDEFIVAGLDLSVDTGFGHFDNVIKNIDSSSLHPEGVEFKYYAAGFGEISEQDVANDGEITTVAEIYREGTVGWVDPDDGDDTTLSLSDLREGRAVTHVAEVKDLDPAAFAGDGSPKQVTFVGGNTGANALGVYLVDTATGEIGGARILVADLSEADPGDAITIDVPTGMTLGLFLVAKADEIGLDLGDYTAGGLSIRNILTGGAANIADGIAPMVTDAAGNVLPIQPLGALGANDGTNFLNPAAGLQAVGLASAALRGQDATLIGFEDRLSTNPSQDADFNDAIVAVGDGPLSAATLALLAREARGFKLGTADADAIEGSAGDDRIDGLSGDDGIGGGAGNDRLPGGAGTDDLDGGRGCDTLRGGGGDDELSGGTGADRLAGGAGDDRLEGDGGADVFVFRGEGFGADAILDFTRVDGDHVELHGLGNDFAAFDSNDDGRLTRADDALTATHGALTLEFDSGDTIAFAGVGALTAADFAFH